MPGIDTDISVETYLIILLVFLLNISIWMDSSVTFSKKNVSLQKLYVLTYYVKWLLKFFKHT